MMMMMMMTMMMMIEIYIALYPKAQSALKHFMGDFVRLHFYRHKLQPCSLQSYYDNSRIHRYKLYPQNRADRLCPLLFFKQCVGSLASHTSTVRRDLRFIVRED